MVGALTAANSLLSWLLTSNEQQTLVHWDTILLLSLSRFLWRNSSCIGQIRHNTKAGNVMWIIGINNCTCPRKLWYTQLSLSLHSLWWWWWWWWWCISKPSLLILFRSWNTLPLKHLWSSCIDIDHHFTIKKLLDSIFSLVLLEVSLNAHNLYCVRLPTQNMTHPQRRFGRTPSRPLNPRRQHGAVVMTFGTEQWIGKCSAERILHYSTLTPYESHTFVGPRRPKGGWYQNVSETCMGHMTGSRISVSKLVVPRRILSSCFVSNRIAVRIWTIQLTFSAGFLSPPRRTELIQL
jgi:hypothetical protein